MKTNRLFDDALDELDITYDDYYRMDLHKPRCVFVLNWLLERKIQKCDTFITGLYPGPMSMLLGKSGFKVTNIWVKKKVEKWESDENKILLSDVWKIENLPGKYDLVVCDDLLQYFSNPPDMIRILMKRLKKDGILIMTCPNVVRAATRLRLLSGRNIFPDPQDGYLAQESSEEEDIWQVIPYREYTLIEVKDLLASSKASIVDGQYITGKKPVEGGFYAPSLRPYFFRKIYSIIQKAIPQMRSYLFAAAKQAE